MHILLLEDDIDLGQTLVDALEAHGHTAAWMKLCSQAMHWLSVPGIHLVVLDTHLPDGHGLDVLQHMRRIHDPRPVIVLTEADRANDRMRSLQSGASDYLIKPVDANALLTCIAALNHGPCAPTPHPLKSLNTVVDFQHQTASHNGQAVKLTAMEWTLLACLASRQGHVWSPKELEHALYTAPLRRPKSNSLEVLVSRLRRKLGTTCISTHRGTGYQWLG